MTHFYESSLFFKMTHSFLLKVVFLFNIHDFVKVGTCYYVRFTGKIILANVGRLSQLFAVNSDQNRLLISHLLLGLRQTERRISEDVSRFDQRCNCRGESQETGG